VKGDPDQQEELDNFRCTSRCKQTKVQKESPGENRSRIYLPTSGVMFVTFFFYAACDRELFLLTTSR
jgi:hypothetical protein